MITAQQAKAKTQSGNAEIHRILNLLEVEINEAAERGEWGLVCYKNVPWEAHPIGTFPKNTPLQDSLIEELKKYGYSAQMRREGDIYVPRGLQDDYDNSGPKYQNYVLVIKW